MSKGLILAIALATVPALEAAAEQRTLGPDAPEAAEVRYQAAFRHYRAGQYSEAAQEFLVAYQLHPLPRLAFNLARSLERSGRPGEAIEAYEDYLRIAPEAEDRAEVQKVIVALRLVVDRGYPTLEITSTPKGLPVRIDGEPADGATPLTVRVKPGKHHVEVHLGERRAAAQAEVEAGQPNSLHLTLPEPGAGASRWGLWPWLAIGVGVVGAGVGIGFGVDAESKEDEREDATSLKDAESLHEEAEQSQVIAWIGAGVAAVGLGTGLTLFLLDHGDVSVTVGPGYATVGGRF